MAQVDAELNPSGDDVATVGVDMHHAHGAAPLGRVLLGHRDHSLHQGGGHLQCVASQGHGGGPGVRLHAHDRAIEPPDAQHPGDHANRHPCIFKHRALLDVGFKISAYRVLTRHLGAQVANALEFFAHRFAVLVAGLVSVL